MLIPHTLLEPDTLARMLEDFVTREGTDNGYEASLEQRVERLRRQIDKGELLIVYHLLWFVMIDYQPNHYLQCVHNR